MTSISDKKVIEIMSSLADVRPTKFKLYITLNIV